MKTFSEIINAADGVIDIMLCISVVLLEVFVVIVCCTVVVVAVIVSCTVVVVVVVVIVSCSVVVEIFVIVGMFRATAISTNHLTSRLDPFSPRLGWLGGWLFGQIFGEWRENFERLSSFLGRNGWQRRVSPGWWKVGMVERRRKGIEVRHRSCLTQSLVQCPFGKADRRLAIWRDKTAMTVLDQIGFRVHANAHATARHCGEGRSRERRTGGWDWLLALVWKEKLESWLKNFCSVNFY